MKLLFSVIFLLSSGFTLARSEGRVEDRKEIDTLIRRVKSLSAKDLSCYGNGDCTSIAVGKRSCGGPAGYVLASLRNKNFTKIQALAEKSSELEHAYNLRYRVISVCSIIRPPHAECVHHSCVTE